VPVALIVVGLLLAVAGIKNNAAMLGKTIGDDFTGAGSFWYWVVAVIIVGSVGYYSKAETVSRLFLGLIVLVFALTNGGVYSKLVEALQNPQAAPANSDAQSGDTSGGSPAAAAGNAVAENPLTAMMFPFASIFGGGAAGAASEAGKAVQANPLGAMLFPFMSIFGGGAK